MGSSDYKTVKKLERQIDKLNDRIFDLEWVLESAIDDLERCGFHGPKEGNETLLAFMKKVLKGEKNG